ncbi:hypothetical protein PBI_VANISOA_30 [Mycobacterium phage Vanisoa]|nr:hypothetical protein PBI_VANISOA_30 [Mycobacterium phage Vanisoa]
MWPTNPLESIGADGAFEIGGGDFTFGQDYTESVVRNLFTVPTASMGNAINILREQLLKLPLEALKGFKGLLPGVPDSAFDTVIDAVDAVMGALNGEPLFFKNEDWQAFLDQIKGAIGGTVQDLIDKFNHTKDEAIQLIKDLLTGLTGASDSDLMDFLNSLGGVFTGIIKPSQLPMIPISHIGDWLADLLPHGDLDGAVSVDGDANWSFDPTLFQAVAGRTTPGSAKAVADGTTLELLSEDLVYVSTGQKININGFLRYTGLVATGSPIEVGLQAYSDLAGTVPVSRPTFFTPAGPTGSSGWLPVSGSWDVPSTVKTVRARLTVKNTATAGAVNFDQIVPSKGGLLSGELVKGIAQGTGNLLDDLGQHVDNVVQQLLGVNATGQSLPDAATAFGSIRDTLLGLSRDVNAMKVQQQGITNSGQNFRVDFSTLPAGPFTAAPFDLFYMGSGTGYLSLTGAQAQWNEVANGDRLVLAKYNQGVTDTDYQWIQATVAAPPETGAKNSACCRMNAAMDTFVYAKGYRTGAFGLGFKSEIGCYVGGVQHVWLTDQPATYNYNLSVRAGVGGNPYRFQVLSGTTVVIDYTDTAHQSQVGANYRAWGFMSEALNGGAASPAPAVFVGCSDNAPAPVMGSTFRTYRSLSSTITVPTGDVPLPSGTFDVVDFITNDLAWNPATNELTIKTPGTYLCTARLEYNNVAGMGATSWNSLWYVNGVMKGAGKPVRSVGPNGVGVPALSLDTGVGGDPFIYYLGAGAVLRLGMQSTGSTQIKGDSLGMLTNMTVTKIS